MERVIERWWLSDSFFRTRPNSDSPKSDVPLFSNPGVKRTVV